MKHFCLFLIYTWISTILALIESVYLAYLIGLLFAIFGFSFVTYILSHTVTSIRTGLGAIDRLQQHGKTLSQQQRAALSPLPIPKQRGRLLIMTEVFGQNYWYWWLPVDPRFRDPEKIFGYHVTIPHHRHRRHNKKTGATIIADCDDDMDDDDNDDDNDDDDDQDIDDRLLSSSAPPLHYHVAPTRPSPRDNTSRGVYQTRRWEFPAGSVDI
jgi:hypothetical protein